MDGARRPCPRAPLVRIQTLRVLPHAVHDGDEHVFFALPEAGDERGGAARVEELGAPRTRLRHRVDHLRRGPPHLPARVVLHVEVAALEDELVPGAELAVLLLFAGVVCVAAELVERVRRLVRVRALALPPLRPRVVRIVDEEGERGVDDRVDRRSSRGPIMDCSSSNLKFQLRSCALENRGAPVTMMP